MLYAIKKQKTIYQGADGVQVDSVREVKGFDDKEEAMIAAANCGGVVINVITPDKRPPKDTPSRRNQSWMKGGG